MSGEGLKGSSRYRKVAADIAAKVVDRQYQAGDRIYARSSIASHYSVSPETARRAVALLSDMGVVEVVKGSGVIIKSSENARKFLKQSMEIDTLIELKRAVINMAHALAKEAERIKTTVEHLVEQADQFRSLNPFVPYEIMIPLGAVCVGKTLSFLRFWQTTRATVIAIRRDGILRLSPGPDEPLEEDDVLYYIGDADSQSDVSRLINGM